MIQYVKIINIVIFFIIGLSNIHYTKASPGHPKEVSSEVEEVEIEVNYRDAIDSETLIHYLNDRFEIPSDLEEQYGQISPEDSDLKYPDSTVAITSLVFVMGSLVGAKLAVVTGSSVIKGAVFTGFDTLSGIAGGIFYGVHGAILSFAAGHAAAYTVWSRYAYPVVARSQLNILVTLVWPHYVFPVAGTVWTRLNMGLRLGARWGLMTFIPTTIALNVPDSPYGSDSVYNFYYNRMEYQFTLRDQYNRATPGSCLVYFAYNLSERQWEYERDACYIKSIPSQEQIYAGVQEHTLIKIPQTEEGRLRRGSWLFDWIQGQTKVVDTGYIPTSNSPPPTNPQITSSLESE